ncbi:MAG TPA: peptidylprolyl isomerase [Flavipsychrobacter sp.]|nr:peptidylprolyl isomerase [Flavipsychrobacter sp.]
MRKLVLTIAASGLVITSGWGQTLFTYGSNPVTKQEFLRNYQKNALNKKPDFSEAALREYLDLYSLFRMKVKEAELQHMDTIPSIQRELDNYRKQLAKNYLTDAQVTNRLYREAYDRMKEERKVAHILLMAPANMGGEDTLKLFKRMDSIYTAITKKKADFGALASQYSEDRGSKERGGEIGFMTSLQTLYPFENAVYTTDIGKVSTPFRTQLGYHIVKVLEKRPARGEVQVAQILVSTPKSRGDEGVEAARKRVDSIQNDLKKGVDFSKLVTKYSDDKFTVNDGGVMEPFGVGRMIPAFEDAAFALKKPGDVSAPIQTEYGFHIIKLVQKNPLQPYDTLLSQIKRQVENDSRAQIARELYFEKVKQTNGYKEYPAQLEEVVKRMAAVPDTGENANTFKTSDFKDLNKTLFTLGGNNYTQHDFISFAENLTRGRLMGQKQVVVRDIYKLYTDRIINDFQEQKLVRENDDFRNLMQEYRDGIMLFELMDKNVWGKAGRDSAGLAAFFESTKGKYQWEPGFTGVVYRFKDETALNKGLKLLNAKKPDADEKIMEELNKDGEALSVQQGRYEFSRMPSIAKDKLVKGKLSLPFRNEDGSFLVVKANQIYNSTQQKSLDDARGYVVAEYQDYLEKKWNEQLRSKYPLKVEDNILRAMVQ